MKTLAGKAVCPVLLALLWFATSLAAAELAAADPAPSPAPTTSPVLTLRPAPTTVAAGDVATLTAALGVPDAVLVLSAMPAGAGTFAAFASATTDSGGNATFTVRPTVTTTYRVDFAGDADWAPATAQTTVRVACSITLGAPTAVFGWDRLSLTLSVSPAHPGTRVVLDRVENGRWVAWRVLTLDAHSRATYGFRATRLGRFAYRVALPADAEHVAAVSAAVSVLVKYPNPYRVPIASAHFVLVDRSQYRLYYLEHGHIVRSFDCVLGRPSLPTPLGHFRIYAKDAHMSGAYGPRRMRYLGMYAIHGTDEPWLLHRFPRNYSHGCTRLSNANILWLFARCPVGTAVWNVS